MHQNNPVRQNLVGKSVKGKVIKSQDDSHNNSQKDVIVRRIKKNDNSKTSYSSSVGFGHKKSNSENISDKPNSKKYHPTKPSVNSVNLHQNSSMKKEEKMTRKEFRNQHYQKALGKFQEFKKEQQMIRKNTPITKYRKGSAKRSKPLI